MSDGHGGVDADNGPQALHHTLGSGKFQAAAGNHTHPGSVTPAVAVAVQDSTTVTTFGDLTHVGPTVTVTVGPSGSVVLFISAQLQNTVAGDYAQASVAGSGANTVGAASAGTPILEVQSATAGQEIGACAMGVLTGLNPGSTTFTMKYRAAGGGTAFFANRNLVAIPL